MPHSVVVLVIDPFSPRVLPALIIAHSYDRDKQIASQIPLSNRATPIGSPANPSHTNRSTDLRPVVSLRYSSI